MYYVVYGFLWLVSLLPLKVLYLFSDFFYFIAYYVLKYRRDVVMTNLDIAFPEKTPEEKKRIAKKFYHNLGDTFIETIKMISASNEYLVRRMPGNWEVVNSLKPTGRPAQLHLGHNFNWEWANVVVPVCVELQFLTVYMPISNKIFERLFRRLRTKGGSKLLRATHMRTDFLPYRKTQYFLGLAADQNPGYPGNAWWFNFFGRPTPFLKGPAKNAISNNTAVVFACIYKVKRGHYRTELSLAEASAGQTTEIDLTRKFVRYLEEVIRQYPEMWLWSHRRWKWQWKKEYGPVLD